MTATDADAPTSERRAVRSTIRIPRKFIIGLLLLVPLVFPFAPLRTDSTCLQVYRLGPRLDFILNCDSYHIVRAERSLGRYLDELGPFRVNPVYIFAGTAVTYVLSPVAVVVRAATRGAISGLKGSYDRKWFTKYGVELFGFTVINFLILGIALVMTIELGGGDTPLAFALGLAVTASDLVFGYFWRQHVAISNVMVPPGAVLFFVLGARTPLVRVRRVALWGIATAAAILTYAYAAVWIPAFFFGWLLQANPRAEEGRAAKGLGQIAAYAACASLPVLAFMAFYAFVLRQPISQEYQSMRQFAWIIDAARQNTLGDALAVHGRNFASALETSLERTALAPIAGLVILLAVSRGAISLSGLMRDIIVQGVVICLIGMLLFNYFQGIYWARQEVTLSIGLLILLARIAIRSDREHLGTLLLGGIALVELAQSFLESPLST